MCYKAEEFINSAGDRMITKFISEDIADKETQDWIISGIGQLEQWKGKMQNKNLETKHVRNKIFELKFKKLPVRILYAYHPVKRKTLLLLHGVIKKRDDLRNKDIKIAEDRYKEIES